MISYICSHKELSEDYNKNCIPVDAPGFYNHPNFTKIEKQEPRYLETYAAFVKKKDYDSSYLRQAEKEIPFIANLLLDELVKDGQVGACANISQVLSKILEKEGYWNYAVSGSVVINFPANSRIPNRYFWTFDDQIDTDIGHAWCFALPFSVIDITLRQQPYRSGEERYIPPCVFEKSESDCMVMIDELCSSSFLEGRALRGIADEEGMECRRGFLKVFKPSIFNYQETSIKYIPCGIKAAETDLENIKSLKLNGKYGNDIYKDIIKPELDKFRKLK